MSRRPRQQSPAVKFSAEAHTAASQILADVGERLAYNAAEIARASKAPVVGPEYVHEAARRMVPLPRRGTQLGGVLGPLLLGAGLSGYVSMLVAGGGPFIVVALCTALSIVGAFLLGRNVER